MGSHVFSSYTILHTSSQFHIEGESVAGTLNQTAKGFTWYISQTTAQYFLIHTYIICLCHSPSFKKQQNNRNSYGQSCALMANPSPHQLSVSHWGESVSLQAYRLWVTRRVLGKAVFRFQNTDIIRDGKRWCHTRMIIHTRGGRTLAL